MSRYYRENPDEPISHDWIEGGRVVKMIPPKQAMNEKITVEIAEVDALLRCRPEVYADDGSVLRVMNEDEFEAYQAPLRGRVLLLVNLSHGACRKTFESHAVLPEERKAALIELMRIAGIAIAGRLNL